MEALHNNTNALQQSSSQACALSCDVVHMCSVVCAQHTSTVLVCSAVLHTGAQQRMIDLILRWRIRTPTLTMIGRASAQAWRAWTESLVPYYSCHIAQCAYQIQYIHNQHCQ